MAFNKPCLRCKALHKNKSLCDTCQGFKTSQDSAYLVARRAYKAEVYVRDAGICQLCNRHVDVSIKYPNPMSLSIDHIVPVSMGGTHDVRNFQLAHLGCNIKRSNID